MSGGIDPAVPPERMSPADRDPVPERDPSPGTDDEVTVVRREEQVRYSTEERESGRVRLRKTIDEQPFEDVIQRGVEHVDIERVPPLEDDSGEIETLADGSVSIPVLEEQVIVEKRLVVRERLIVRKRVVHEEETITTTLKRELVELDADDEALDRVHVTDTAPPAE